MAEKTGFTVHGVQEVQIALIGAERGFDTVRASEAAADAILPEVRANTRVQSGASRQSWRTEPTADGASFVNEMEYALFQEFGTEDVDPTFAVFRAWEGNEKQVLKAFEQEAKAAGKDAGFNT